MKKMIIFLLGFFLLTQFLYAEDRDQEYILNRVFDSTNNALRATVSGNASLTDLTADSVQVGTATDKKFIIVKEFTSAGINYAIDSLGSTGGEIYLPEGDYDITGTITFDNNNTIIRGAGFGTRLFATNRFTYGTVSGTPVVGQRLTGATTGYTATAAKVDTTNAIVWYYGLSNAANFNNGEIINWSGGAATTLTAAPTEQSFNVFDFNQKINCAIFDLYVLGGSGGGNGNYLVYDNGVTGTSTFNKVINCGVISSDSIGIYLVANNYDEVMGNYVQTNDTQGIALDGSGYSFIINNTILSNGTLGINIAASSVNNSVVGNVIRDSLNENIIVQAAYNSIIGNKCRDAANTYADIKVSDDFNIISGNVLISAAGKSEQGILLSEADYCTVTNNYSEAHDTCGIQVNSDCQNTIVKANNMQNETTQYIRNDTVGSVETLTSDRVTTIGGAVGRMSIVSSDGTTSYVVLYARN